jgi:UDPglucose 6-dehydrogenase
LKKKSGKKEGRDFEIITNPEFLRESMAIADTTNPHIIVLGGTRNKFMNMIESFYQKLYKGVQIITTNNNTAELIKYTNNSFLATKISFINQISNICQSVPGANVEDVAKAIGLDPRIGSLFLNAGPGYGGSCLPKDVKAIINFSNKIGIKPTLLDAVETVNKHQLDHLITTVRKAVGELGGKQITVLGLAFKPDTDDIRDSVSIKLIKSLLKLGVKVKAHDPKAIENTKRIFANKIEYFDSIRESLKDSDCGIIVTNWKEYSKINDQDIKVMNKNIIVDTRRILHKRNLNIKYYPIGIGQM